MPQIWDRWCRLCAEKADGPKIESDIEEIIRKYFLGDVYWVNESPKRICKPCNSFLHKLMQFQVRSARVQAFLSGLDFTTKYLPDSKLNIRELRLRYGINIIEPSADDDVFEDMPAVVVVPKSSTSTTKRSAPPPTTKPSMVPAVKKAAKGSSTPPATKTVAEVPIPVVVQPTAFMKVEEIDEEEEDEEAEEGERKNPLCKFEVGSDTEDPSASGDPTEKSMPCPSCNRIFVSESQLKHHMNLMHPTDGQSSYDCQTCKKSFCTAEHLEAHISDKHTFSEVICDQCGMKFTRKAEYNRHYRTHALHSPYKCPICARDFKERGKLNRHLEAHTGRTYDCKVCGLKLKTPQTYNQHLKIHSDERPFECELCGKNFKLAKNLRRHMQSHKRSGHDCNICGAGFTSVKKLEKHLKEAHGKSGEEKARDDDGREREQDDEDEEQQQQSETNGDSTSNQGAFSSAAQPLNLQSLTAPSIPFAHSYHHPDNIERFAFIPPFI